MFFRNIAEFLAPIAPKVKHRLKKYENTFAYNTLKNTWKWFVNSSLVTGILRRYVEKQQMIQDKYDLTELKKAKKIVLVFIPAEHTVYGGYMSFFSMATYSRMLLPDRFVLLCTLPTYRNGVNVTYAKNELFKNDEKLWRLEQVVKNAGNCQELILHIPEICVSDFCEVATQEERTFLKNIPHLQINIMLQNIDLMPPPEECHRLFEFTKDITLTTAHKAYSTQITSDEYQMPLKYISTYFDLSIYKKYPFQKKEKLILVSRDKNDKKSNVIHVINVKLPDYEVSVIDNITFDMYMDYIAKAMFVISFGEGFDGYFIQPCLVGSVGIAVYNERFFPDSSWKELDNVYRSFDEMALNIAYDVRRLEKDPNAYQAIVDEMKRRHDEIYGKEKYLSFLREFYIKNYDYLPRKSAAPMMSSRQSTLKKVYIVGGDGFARECAHYMQQLEKMDKDLIFGGFISHQGYKVDYKDMEGYFCGDISEHIFKDYEYVVIGAALPPLRSLIYNDLKKRGVRLYTLVAPGCSLNEHIEMGEGNIFIAPFQASVHMKIGRCNVFNGGVIVGHDNVIGDFNFFAPCSQILGNAKIGNYNSIGANAIIIPNAKIGDCNKISPLSVVYKGCRSLTVMHGNPAVKTDDIDPFII